MYELGVIFQQLILNFIFQQIAPDTERFENTKEQERQQWLKDLGE